LLSPEKSADQICSDNNPQVNTSQVTREIFRRQVNMPEFSTEKDTSCGDYRPRGAEENTRRNANVMAADAV